MDSGFLNRDDYPSLSLSLLSWVQDHGICMKGYLGLSEYGS